jgi:hypothetical protein
MNARLAAFVVLLVSTCASAEERIFRCGPDGSQYSQAPCPNGTVVAVADPRTLDQQRDARSASARDAKLADDLARERRFREQAAARQGVAYLGPVRANATESSSTQHSRKPKAKHKPGEDSRLSPPMRSTAERR